MVNRLDNSRSIELSRKYSSVCSKVALTECQITKTCRWRGGCELFLLDIFTQGV